MTRSRFEVLEGFFMMFFPPCPGNLKSHHALTGIAALTLSMSIKDLTHNFCSAKKVWIFSILRFFDGKIPSFIETVFEVALYSSFLVGRLIYTGPGPTGPGVNLLSLAIGFLIAGTSGRFCRVAPTVRATTYKKHARNAPRNSFSARKCQVRVRV